MEPEFGYPQLARALRRSADPRTLDAQLHELFRHMIFNILVANTDDHEKNHALLCYVSGRTMKLELSPGYDIVPTGSGALEHQFMISDTSREPSLPEAMTVGVTEPDIIEIAALVDAPDLQAQRQSFSADAYAQAGKPRRKRSPGAKAFR